MAITPRAITRMEGNGITWFSIILLWLLCAGNQLTYTLVSKAIQPSLRTYTYTFFFLKKKPCRRGNVGCPLSNVDNLQLKANVRHQNAVINYYDIKIVKKVLNGVYCVTLKIFRAIRIWHPAFSPWQRFLSHISVHILYQRVLDCLYSDKAI